MKEEEEEPVFSTFLRLSNLKVLDCNSTGAKLSEMVRNEQTTEFCFHLLMSILVFLLRTTAYIFAGRSISTPTMNVYALMCY